MRDGSAPADRKRSPVSTAREKRLAEALRDNLSKRKSQQRVRREPARDLMSRRSSDSAAADGDEGASEGQ